MTRLLTVILNLFLMAPLLPAQSVKSPQSGADAKVDFNLTRREIQNVEGVINSVINSTFSSSPFALAQKARGAYLPGYGIAFNFLVNIHRAVINTPFGDSRRYPEILPEEKKRKIEEIKEKLVRVLADYGDGLRQVRKDESVTIVAFIEDRNFPDEENQNKTIVLRAYKRDLDDLARKENRWRELKQRMEIIEY